MKRKLIVILVLITGSLCLASGINTKHAADFYISPAGNDAWTGTLADPDTNGTDGPFATLERARDAVRELKKSRTGDIVVLVREGVYQLEETLVFGLEDSGEPGSTITYAAYPKIGPGKGLGVKLFSAYLNRDLQENNGEQTVVLSLKDGKADRSAFTYNLERGGAGEIKPNPWIWATDLSGNWFYRKNAVNRMSVPVMVANAVDAISKNGVVMLNVALKGDGTIPEKQIAYLTAFGDFLKINGEGIYDARPWKVFGEGPLEVKDGRQGENHADYSQADIRFTAREGILYAYVLAPPSEDILIKTLAAGGVLDGEIVNGFKIWLWN